MRQLLPSPADVDPVAAYLAAPRPARPDRPWVTVGMIASVDGATAVDGRSGALGGPADKAVFRAVRALADVILVAAGTVRAERYGPVRLSPDARAARVRAGRPDRDPQLAIVSGSLDLDLDSPLFAAGDRRPLVFTTVDADPRRQRALEDRAEVRLAGRARVDLDDALGQLRAGGTEVVVCEGGPRLNAGLVDAGVVDEWCVSIAPLVAGGASTRVVHGAGAAAEPGRVELVSLLEGDGLLFGRWVRAGTRSA